MFVSVLVKKGRSLSLLRVDSSLYRAQAKTLKVSSSEMEVLQQKFKDLPGSSLEKLRELQLRGFFKSEVGAISYIFELRGSASIKRGGVGPIIFFPRAHSYPDSRVAI